MTRIYRTTDRIPVKIDDITLYISPLSYEQKAEIQEAMMGFTSGDIKSATRGVVLSIKYAVKDVEGIEDGEGEPYKPEMQDGALTDEAVSELMNLDMTEKLTLVCSSLLNGVPKEFTDNDGNALEGVEIVKKGKPGKKS